MNKPWKILSTIRYSRKNYDAVSNTILFLKADNHSQLNTHPHTHTLRVCEKVATMSDIRSKFLEVYSLLKSELLNDPAFEFTGDSRQWVERVNSQFYLYFFIQIYMHTYIHTYTRACVMVIYMYVYMADWCFVIE